AIAPNVHVGAGLRDGSTGGALAPADAVRQKLIKARYILFSRGAESFLHSKSHADRMGFNLLTGFRYVEDIVAGLICALPFSYSLPRSVRLLWLKIAEWRSGARAPLLAASS